MGVKSGCRREWTTEQYLNRISHMTHLESHVLFEITSPFLPAFKWNMPFGFNWPFLLAHPNLISAFANIKTIMLFFKKKISFCSLSGQVAMNKIHNRWKIRVTSVIFCSQDLEDSIIYSKMVGKICLYLQHIFQLYTFLLANVIMFNCFSL